VLLGKYGQGGKAGYTQNLKYHNSYIIADFFEAYVLETAGKHWVYEKVKDIRSISNTLSVRKKNEGCSSQLVEHALSKDWCRSSEEFDFKSCYESKLHPHFTKGDIRRATAEKYLREKTGSLSVADMMLILRSHGGKEDVESFRDGSMECVCMHAGGGLITSQTTGSFVVQLKDGKINIWATGSSIPCISVFKPIWFIGLNDELFSEKNQEGLIEYWRGIELFHRMVLDGRIAGMEGYLYKRDKLEAELAKLELGVWTDTEKIKLTDYAFACEKKLIEEMVSSNKNSSSNTLHSNSSGSMYYKWYWKQQNKTL
jgi:hypothetical protein